MGGQLKQLRNFAAILIVATYAVAGASMLLPQPAGTEGNLVYSATGTPVTLLDALFAVSAGILFLRALKSFKPELKPAYRLIAIGAMVLGVLTLIDPYTEYYGLWDHLFFNTASYMSYFLGSIFTYFGMRLFYKQLGVQGKLASLRLMGAAFLVVFVLYNLLPHRDTWADVPSEYLYDLLQILTIVPALAYGTAAAMTVRMLRVAGKDYRPAFGWLAAAIGLQAFTAVIILAMQLTGYDNWYFNTRWYELTFILGNAALLGAAYQFNAISARGAQQYAPPKDVTSIDILRYAGGMASDTRGFDAALDDMRIISARMRPGIPLAEKDQQQLKDGYLAIENYLVHSDKLRTFTRDEVRAQISRHFGLDRPDAPDTFWKLLKY